MRAATLLGLAAAAWCGAAAPTVGEPLTIPAIAPAAPRAVTSDDLAALRHIDALSLSPDGTRYAIAVRQADADANRFRVTWFAGSARGGALVRLGDGGEAGPRVMFTGHTPGVIEASEARWSPDGAWLAFKLRRDGEVQLWRSRADGRKHERLTASAGDVESFAWSEDGRALYFNAQLPRAELRARAEARAREGYRVDEDLWQFTDFMAPRLIRAVELAPGVRVFDLKTRAERAADEAERAAFERAVAPRAPAAVAAAAMARRPDDDLRHCAPAAPERLICVRETAVLPPHVAAIDATAGSVEILADVNPEFRNLALGRVERFEWDLPKLRWHERGPLAGLYGKRTHGYILYPPDFDPSRRYPVFVDPYMAKGFLPLGAEHPLHAYAAAGIVVLRTQFPLPIDREKRGAAASMKRLYAEDLDFPHLTMLMESTLRGLDAVVARGFADPQRVGIGGVSHGTFVPLYMLQKHDRIAAISISSPNWGPLQHYNTTRKSRDAIAASFLAHPEDDWSQRPEGKGREFWRKIDVADHVDEIEAPILMQLAAQEAFAQVRLIRHLADAALPYDAYVFAGETHIKSQPAHLRTIMRRNLDWFRFWLQDHVDAAPARREQYAKWLQLRAQQCRNERALRDYCGPLDGAPAS